jgi:hypothetical protein
MAVPTLLLMSQRPKRLAGKYTCTNCRRSCTEAYRYDGPNRRLIYLCLACKVELLGTRQGSTVGSVRKRSVSRRRKGKRRKSFRPREVSTPMGGQPGWKLKGRRRP